MLLRSDFHEHNLEVILLLGLILNNFITKFNWIRALWSPVNSFVVIKGLNLDRNRLDGSRSWNQEVRRIIHTFVMQKLLTPWLLEACTSRCSEDATQKHAISVLL